MVYTVYSYSALLLHFFQSVNITKHGDIEVDMICERLHHASSRYVMLISEHALTNGSDGLATTHIIENKVVNNFSSTC